MTEKAPSTEEFSAPRTLTSRQLTLSLILLTLIPVGFVMWMALAMTPQPEPRLDAIMTIGTTSWSPDDTQEKIRLTPALVIKNRSKENWRNIAAGINDQFYFYRQEPLAAGEEARIPLEFFSTKGNARFHPPTNSVQKLILYAQLPTGGRGVMEREYRKRVVTNR